MGAVIRIVDVLIEGPQIVSVGTKLIAEFLT